MKRRALIIASPLKGTSDYLPGVTQDVKNMRNFLMSSIGGAWKKEEIKVLVEPTAYRLRGIPAYFRGTEFALLMFSGHGFMDGNKSYINLNARQTICTDQLATKAKRETTIMDMCRKDCSIDHFDGLGAVDFAFDMGNMQNSRLMMDHYLMTAPIGRNVIYSTSPGEEADDTEDGGAYTVTLMESIINWYNWGKSPVFRIKDLFKNSRKLMAESGRIQRPQLLYSTNYPNSVNMPFAINPYFRL